jgi:hypothetical protein
MSYQKSTTTPSKSISRNVPSTVKKDKGTHVDLSDKEITSLDLSFLGSSSSASSSSPAWTAKERAALEMVSSLDVSRNNLREIPRELALTLPKLLEINASRNLLCESTTIITASVSPMPSPSFSSSSSSSSSSSLCFPRTLTRLDVSHNQLSSIADLVVLTRLRYLDVGHNRIMSFGICRRIVHPFPELLELRANNNWIKSLRGVECITALELIDARCNSISFPEDASPLEKLPNLKFCLLEGNPLLMKQQQKPRYAVNDDDSKEEEEERVFASTQTSDQSEDEEEEDEDETQHDEKEQSTTTDQSRISVEQQKPKINVTSPPPAPAPVTSKTNHTTTRTTRTSSSSRTGGIISSYAASHQQLQNNRRHHDTTATLTNISSVTNTSTSSSAVNLPSTTNTDESSICSTNVQNNNNNTLVLLDFERKSNEHLRQELEQIKLLLRNTRSAISTGSSSTKSLKLENEKLKKQISELEQHASKEKVEKAGMKKRFEERFAKLEQEHKRTVVAQEEEIQELRLQLDAATSMLSHYEQRFSKSPSASQPGTTTATRRNSVSNHKTSSSSTSPAPLQHRNTNLKNKHVNMNDEEDDYDFEQEEEERLTPYPSPSNQKKTANKFAQQLKHWISSEVQ